MSLASPAKAARFNRSPSLKINSSQRGQNELQRSAEGSTLPNDHHPAVRLGFSTILNPRLSTTTTERQAGHRFRDHRQQFSGRHWRMAPLYCVALARSHTWRVCRSSLLHPFPAVYENDASGGVDTPDIVSSGHNFTTDSTAHWAGFVIHDNSCVLSPSCLRQGASLTIDTWRQQDPAVAEKTARRYARVF